MNDDGKKGRGAVAIGLFVVGTVAVLGVVGSIADTSKPDRRVTIDEVADVETLGECLREHGMSGVERRDADLIRAQSLRADLIRFQQFDTSALADEHAAGLDSSIVASQVDGRVVAMWSTNARSVGIEDAVGDCLGAAFKV